jgi:hypothetical protein
MEAPAPFDHHHIRIGANRPTVTPIQIIERPLTHKKQSIAEPLHTRLKPKRYSAYRVVAPHTPCTVRTPFAAFRSKDETALHNLREDQDSIALCLRAAARLSTA